MDFASLDDASVQFYKALLQSILTEPPEAAVREAFSRIAPLPHLKKLKDTLLVFIKHFVATSAAAGEKRERVEGRNREKGVANQRIKMVEHIFRSPDQLR